jgi:RNA polymerase sigma factor (sigma-70 family)
MIPTRSGGVGRQLEGLWASGSFTGLTDAQLLSRFAGGGMDTADAAFRELIDRHGPMVLGVCRQILRSPQDADDAFQATFLVLVRKAGSIRVGDSLAPWLYGVAYRTAHRARATAARHRTDPVDPMTVAVDSSPEVGFGLDVRPLLHEELARLPGKYREPIVLCHLEGKTHEEAARLLSWPVGTVSGRLSRGRQPLKARLERRGVEAPPALLAARWLTDAQAALPPSLVEGTLAAAAHCAAAAAISTSVQSLTQGVLRAMLLHKIKLVSVALVAVGAASGGLVWALRASHAANPPAPLQAAEKPAQPPGDRFAGEGLGRPMEKPAPRPGLPGKNAPNLTDIGNPFPIFRSSAILVAESPDRRSIQAMSLEADEATWDKLTLPSGVTGTAYMGDDTLVLLLRGKKIDRVAAFSKYLGKWRTQQLATPAEEELTPYVMPGGAVYQVGNDIYAFSAATGTWGVLRLDGEEKPRVSASPKDIEVLQGNKLYVFSLKHGSFSPGIEVNLKPFRSEPPAAGQ